MRQKSFKTLIKEIRIAEKQTLKHFSDRLSEDMTKMAQYELGILPPPNEETIKRWANILALSSTEIESLLTASTKFRKRTKSCTILLCRNVRNIKDEDYKRLEKVITSFYNPVT